MSSPTTTQASDPARVAEAHALRRALEPFSTLRALHAHPGWPALAARVAALLDGVRLYAPPSPRPSTTEPGRVRVAQWTIEHGNRFEAIARAFRSQAALAAADLVTLNEVDLGMARSGNRDVAAELCVRLGMHAAWAAMFLESTRGRDDDSLTALASDNAESLFGLALLSRWPIAAARLVTLPGPERTLFDELRAAGFAWEPYADFAPTLSVRFSRLGEVHALPRPLRALASRGLRWAERRGQLRLDWIAARGFRHAAGRGRTIQGLGGLVHESLDEATYASDHAPIVAELGFE